MFASLQRRPFPAFPASISLALHIFVLALSASVFSVSPLAHELGPAIVDESKRVIWVRFQKMPILQAPPEFRRTPVSQGNSRSASRRIIARGKDPIADRHILNLAPLTTIAERVPHPDLIRIGANLSTVHEVPPPPKPAATKVDSEQDREIPPVAQPLAARRPAGMRPPPQRTTAAPNFVAPPSLDGISGSLPTGTTLVVLNEDPSAIPAASTPPPPSSGKLSIGETGGDSSVRESAGKGGFLVPNISVEATGTNFRADVPSSISRKVQVREISYQVARLGAARNMVSAPLRPSSRAVPPHVEKMFAGRSVFTLIIPMSKAEGYRADWVLWFGERGEAPSDGRVRPPLPDVKIEPDVADRTANSGLIRVRAAAVLGSDGVLRDVRILACSEPQAEVRAADDLLRWKFRPATRDGAAIEADLLIDFTIN